MCPGVLLALARFIPAGAGNTLPLSALLARNTVYPRWRGEHRSSHYFPFFFDGLSPLARGTRRQRIVRLPLHRFIPAGAGNTSTLSITTDREPVYPRWRGEHPNGSALSYPQIGLSPLARGTQSDAIDALIDARFIPAGAGNTAPLKICTKAIAVYPRWRGEHYFCNAQRYSRIGLSPLARGTLAKQTSGYAWCRFIPAGAGNTKFILINTAFVSVYPRWRGEHFTTIGGHATAHGLSPLARGTQIWGAPLMKSKRFIPAGAGNTAADSRAGHHRPVYPRWRGEHQLSDVSLAWRHGLSPLARGTPVHIRFLVARSRFIPAGAGNTDQIPVPQSTPSVYPRWRGEHN
ncbi:Domain of uncharacterised function (DUF2825) [Escherichia coli]|nr:Domain of uncharacterised function (DUF2825) [Escherichia coli]SQR44465.1 Domain of uncharacterised function (DUF2825) [Escherichia coli]SQR91255.1 Domain of uncharacterised function (DUF2825) [Escherichia coli]